MSAPLQKLVQRRTTSSWEYDSDEETSWDKVKKRGKKLFSRSSAKDAGDGPESSAAAAVRRPDSILNEDPNAYVPLRKPLPDGFCICAGQEVRGNHKGGDRNVMKAATIVERRYKQKDIGSNTTSAWERAYRNVTDAKPAARVLAIKTSQTTESNTNHSGKHRPFHYAPVQFGYSHLDPQTQRPQFVFPESYDLQLNFTVCEEDQELLNRRQVKLEPGPEDMTTDIEDSSDGDAASTASSGRREKLARMLRPSSSEHKTEALSSFKFPWHSSRHSGSSFHSQSSGNAN
ncbi:MAG: hypothetical protein Q9162_005213 [Coniocarpon cinnabarinum]